MSAETLYAMSWVLGRARIEVLPLLRDPLSFKIPDKVFLSKDYQKYVAEILLNSMPKIDLSEDVRLKSSKAASIVSGLEDKKDETTDSCHNIITDSENNWVSMMHTGNGGGAVGIVVDGVYMHGGSKNGITSGIGRRISLPICPIMVFDDEGPNMALGSPGMPVYSTPIVLANIFDFEMDPYSAIDAPRFWWLERDNKKGIINTLEIENRIPENTLKGLLKLGVQTKPLGTYRWNTGSFQIVWKDKKTGLLKGTSDPRRLGYAEGL
jgi:gamma-glutamyltranspeptidase